MSFPHGAPYEGTDYGASADGSIPGMPDRTEAAVTEQLKAGVGDGHWGGLGGGLIAMILSFIAGAITAILGGFATVLDAISNTVNDDYVAQLPIITDHSQQLADLQDQFNQLILQGNAIVFPDADVYIPTPGILSIDVILIGAGAGGASGRWDILADQRSGGGGGGGGGEVHLNIPANLLPKDGSGNFVGIPIGIGTGGTRGVGSGSPGQGGGNTTFGTGEYLISAGGGNGGAVLATNAGSPGGAGGVGMVQGGAGGRGAAGNGGVSATEGGFSTSSYDLNGGGGGGGGGGTPIWAGMSGGSGGISKGGATNQNGTEPSAIVATGGGGGGGASGDTFTGGYGAYPAGGGGGGYGGVSTSNSGGNGGHGIAYVIERFT